MKKASIFTLMLLIFSLLLAKQALADRSAPSKVEPVIYKNIRIVAENSSPDTMSLVTAFDVKTNKLLWSKEVYKIIINPFVEEDIQWVFIRELRIEKDKLIVINEKQEKFILDPNTGKILNKNTSIVIWIPIIIIFIFIVYVYKVKKKGI